MNYPIAKIQPVAVTHGRVSYTDNYQWLEDDTPESLEFQAQQNRLTLDWMANNPARTRAEVLMDAIPGAGVDLPTYSGGRWFRKRLPGLQPMEVIEVADTIEGPWRLLLDLNAMSKGESLTIDSMTPSPDGRKLAIAWGIDGHELAAFRVIDVDSGEWLLESIRQVRPLFPSWLPDSSGFYYAAWDPAISLFQAQVYRQVLGAEPVTKPEEFEIGHSLVWAKRASDGRHVFIIADHLNPRPEFIRDDSAGGAWRPFLKGETALFRGDIIGDHYYAVTDDGAKCGRVVSIPLATPTDRSTWKELIPGSENVLGTLLVVDGHLVLTDLVDTYSRMRVFDINGKLKGEVQLPGRGSISTLHFLVFNMIDMVWAGEPGEVLFPFCTPAQSPALYKFNIRDLKVSQLTQPVVRIDASLHDFSAISADGARVPYCVIARNDVDLSKPQPTIIYGYGGFAIPLVPGWADAHYAAWVEAGGVLVFAHLRGGGELGPDMWHQGRLKFKQNTFNDVYAIAEDLIARGITTAAQLGVTGGSYGGVMTTVVVVQRPDLFRAAVAHASAPDLLGRGRDPICLSATLDGGDPEDPEMSEVQGAYSPYSNVKDGTVYPALLLDSGANDARTPAWHVRKFAARIQPANAGNNPILLRIREGSGHGERSRAGKRSEGADYLTFFIDQLGLKA
ncbi:MAG: prolyl oligopeptidase family serine peptidase [Pseudomonadota bacterium]